jgi:Protein of unknown function (DUF3054)
VPRLTRATVVAVPSGPTRPTRQAPPPSQPAAGSAAPSTPAVPDPPPAPSAHRPAHPRTVVRRAVLDAVLDVAGVLAFAAAGRSTHDRDGGALGVLDTAWPFLAGAALGWVLVRAWRAPGRAWPTGVAVWAAAWVGGLVLRAATGDGTAPAFVVVAGFVLGALLVGRRVLVTALSPAARRRRAPRSAPGR